MSTSPATPNPITTLIVTPPVNLEPNQGKLQSLLISWFGASYETTISGYILALGGILTTIGAFLGESTRWGRNLTVSGTIISLIGGQQLGQRAKSTKVTGADSK